MQSNALRAFWYKTQYPNADFPFPVELDYWDAAVKSLYKQGRGLEETIQYLYFSKPSYENFLAWIDLNAAHFSSIPTIGVQQQLTQHEIDFFKQNGYLVLKKVVDEKTCAAACSGIYQFINAQPNNPKSWYLNVDGKNGLMLKLYDHPALDAIRKNAAIQHVYETLYGSKQIYPSYDKAGFNPPETANFQFLGSNLHWDVSLALPIPFKLQGLVYLTNVSATGGAFSCVPGFHLQLEQWLKEVPAGIHPREYALSTLHPVPIPGNAGDMVIWHQALPHAATPNLDATPRLVQYLTYLPENSNVADRWI
jgi:hypothetical protein